MSVSNFKNKGFKIISKDLLLFVIHDMQLIILTYFPEILIESRSSEKMGIPVTWGIFSVFMVRATICWEKPIL